MNLTSVAAVFALRRENCSDRCASFILVGRRYRQEIAGCTQPISESHHSPASFRKGACYFFLRKYSEPTRPKFSHGFPCCANPAYAGVSLKRFQHHPGRDTLGSSFYTIPQPHPCCAAVWARAIETSGEIPSAINAVIFKMRFPLTINRCITIPAKSFLVSSTKSAGRSRTPDLASRLDTRNRRTSREIR